jgi:hypothetical protein
MPYAVPAERVEQPEQVAYPKRYNNHDHDIQYRLDGRLHGNEAVYDSKTPTATSAKITLMSGKRFSFRAIRAHGSCGFLLRKTWPHVSIQPGLVYFVSATALV